MELGDYVKLVMDARPHLKVNSAKTYAISIKSLAPPEATSKAWMMDSEYVLKGLERYKPTTRKNTLNALIVVIDGDSEAFRVYTEARDKYNQEYMDHNKAHKKTASQEKNWTEWTDYLKLVKRVGHETKDLRGSLSKREARKLQDYLVLLLYAHYPLRNDFGDVKIIKKTKFNNLSAEAKKGHNYLLLAGQGMSLLLNDYKTSGKYGTKKVEMSQEVIPTIRRWLKVNTSGYLLRDPAHPEEPMGSNGITKTLARIGLKYLDKRLGSSLLRHSYLSHKYAGVTEEKKKDADLMMHSVGMQSGYIKA